MPQLVATQVSRRRGRRTSSRRFGVMGSSAEITLVGDVGDGLMTHAIERLHQLERRWSRFIATSEVTAINHCAGHPVAVSDDTLLLVELAVEGWRRTDGRFDPTLLDALLRIGYVGDFGTLTTGHVAECGARSAAPAMTTATASTTAVNSSCGSIAIADHTVRLPPGGCFDPGGIGKGLAADLVGHELATIGVEGGCVNVGGDLRVWGVGPDGDRWRVGAAGRTFAITDAGVATSGTQRRAWRLGDEQVHHLIDPSTARSAHGGPATATVVAGSAWQAEVFATALLVTPADAARDDVERWGVEAFVT